MLLATGHGSFGNNCSLMILLSASMHFTLFLRACFADGSKERETETLLINKSVLLLQVYFAVGSKERDRDPAH